MPHRQVVSPLTEGDADVAHRLGAPTHRTPIEQMQAGGDRVAHAATRDMACCAVSGQGAGVVAALSVRHDYKLDRADVTELQTELHPQGIRIA